jgi:putative inorganic carbon (hco3(-)) transporter
MLRKTFNVVLLLFCGIVPLVPFKTKVAAIPLSADFVIGGLLIFIGILNLLDRKREKTKQDHILKLPLMKSLAVFIGIFLLMSIVSISYSMNKTVAISEVARAVEYVMMFYIVFI